VLLSGVWDQAYRQVVTAYQQAELLTPHARANASNLP
jgi:hypothetical protein